MLGSGGHRSGLDGAATPRLLAGTAGQQSRRGDADLSVSGDLEATMCHVDNVPPMMVCIVWNATADRIEWRTLLSDLLGGVWPAFHRADGVTMLD